MLLTGTRFHRLLAAALAPALLFPLAGSLEAAEVFTPQHVARLRWVGSAALSPNGTYIAYVLHVPPEPLKEPSGPAWDELHVIFPNGTSRPFVTGEVNAGSVDWTRDQKGISFLAKRGKDKFKSLYVIPVDGGEARRLIGFSSDIRSYSWSPDGSQVAFIAEDPPAEEEEKLKEKGFQQEIYEEVFRPLRVHIASAADPEAKPRALELPGFPSELSWAPQGNLLALALAPTPLVDDGFMKRRVHVVDADSGAVVARFENPGKLGKIAWSPDARHIAFIAAEDLNDPSAGRLMVAPAAGGEVKQLLAGFEGEVADLAWKDPDTMVYMASEGVWTTIGEIRRDGSAHKGRVPPGQVVLSNLSLSRDGRTMALLMESPRHPQEVAVLSAGNSMPRRMSDSNPWLEGMRFAEQEVATWQARDGLRLEGILIRPLDEEKGKAYPLILSVHGGPEAHERNGWLTGYGKPGQTAAARGFAVFYPNYRGSTGRGVEFSKLGQADYAGKEFDDLVDAVDHFIAVGLADPKKIGITGGSYGGYASAWAATYYSERFAASVMFVGISDLISKTGTTDIPLEMHHVHARKELYDNWQWFLERSPLYHVKKARTPILILHGKEDTRVHPSQSMELYRHLKVLDQAPVRLVLYPGEGHGNRKSAARLDYNLRMLGWFEHYLKGPGGPPPPHKLDYGVPAEGEKAKPEARVARDSY
jgi:dipeptidyl aminopeptidase/acylaminoacyl peptidase